MTCRRPLNEHNKNICWAVPRKWSCRQGGVIGAIMTPFVVNPAPSFWEFRVQRLQIRSREFPANSAHPRVNRPRTVRISERAVFAYELDRNASRCGGALQVVMKIEVVSRPLRTVSGAAQAASTRPCAGASRLQEPSSRRLALAEEGAAMQRQLAPRSFNKKNHCDSLSRWRNSRWPPSHAGPRLFRRYHSGQIVYHAHFCRFMERGRTN